MRFDKRFVLIKQNRIDGRYCYYDKIMNMYISYYFKRCVHFIKRVNNIIIREEVLSLTHGHSYFKNQNIEGIVIKSNNGSKAKKGSYNAYIIKNLDKLIKKIN
jgi:hypothetical protein